MAWQGFLVGRHQMERTTTGAAKTDREFKFESMRPDSLREAIKRRPPCRFVNGGRVQHLRLRPAAASPRNAFDDSAHALDGRRFSAKALFHRVLQNGCSHCRIKNIELFSVRARHCRSLTFFVLCRQEVAAFSSRIRCSKTLRKIACLTSVNCSCPESTLFCPPALNQEVPMWYRKFPIEFALKNVICVHTCFRDFRCSWGSCFRWAFRRISPSLRCSSIGSGGRREAIGLSGWRGLGVAPPCLRGKPGGPGIRS